MLFDFRMMFELYYLLLTSYYLLTQMAIQKLHMDIEGMHCGACATGIQMVTEGVDGVSKVFVSYDAKNGDWEYDDAKTSKEAIVKEIEALGYKAK